MELLRKGMHDPPTDPKTIEAMQLELKSTLFALAGVDPANPAEDSPRKLAATEADVLARRDPKLRDEILGETKRYVCRVKQSEAKSGLKALYVAERSWQAEHDTYSKNLHDIGTDDAALEAKRYGYAVLQADKDHFRARATGKDDMEGDVWEIDEGGEPKNTASVCPAPSGQPAAGR